MSGWIIPTPFAIPLTVTVTGAPSAPGSSIDVVATFVRESVVRRARRPPQTRVVAASPARARVEPGAPCRAAVASR